MDVIRKFAEKKKATPAQIALAWLLQESAVDRADSWDDKIGAFGRESWSYEN